MSCTHGGHHLTNVLLHIATVVALFLVLRAATGATWRSAFVAAVFAIHPLRVESVAWISERKDVLGAFFFMLTLGAYRAYTLKESSRARHFAVIALFAIGLMCKDMLITLPFVLLLLDYWPLRRMKFEMPGGGLRPRPEILADALRLVVEKIPLFVLSLASCIITSSVPEQAGESADRLALAPRLANGVISCVIYLRQMIWPAGLAIPYPYPTSGWPTIDVVFALALLIALSIPPLLLWRKRPYLITGWLWYLGMLVPVSGIVQISYYSHADRYTYLPQIGLLVLITWGMAGLCSRFSHRRAALGALATLTLAGLMRASYVQAGYWKNNETLWNHVLAVTPRNATAEFNLGTALQHLNALDDAIGHFRKALEIKPDYAEVYSNLGAALQSQGSPAEGMVYEQRALDIDPENAGAHNNLGFILQLGGNIDEAIPHYQKALTIKPDMVETRLNLGIAYRQKGDMAGALAEFRKAVEIDPRSAKAQNDLGLALLQSGNIDASIGYFRKALDLEPGFSDARQNLDLALREKE